MSRFAWLLVLLLLAAGCGAPRGATAPAGAPSPSGPAARDVTVASGEDAPSGESAPVIRKIIRNASLTLRVADVRKAFAECRGLALQAGGFVAGSNIAAGEHQPREAGLELRVPAYRLDEVLGEMAGLGKVLNQTEQAQDVTEEWVDLEARLRALSAEERQLLSLLDRAGSVKDLLEVERELGRVRQESEALQGRKRLLDRQVELSTLSVTLYGPESAPPEEGWLDWMGQDVQDAADLFTGLSRLGFQTLLYVLVLTPFALPFWLGARALRRRQG